MGTILAEFHKTEAMIDELRRRIEKLERLTSVLTEANLGREHSLMALERRVQGIEVLQDTLVVKAEPGKMGEPSKSQP